MGWRSSFRRVARWLHRVFVILPPTGRGWLVLFAAGFALWLYGFQSLDLVLFVIGSAGIFLVGVGVLVVGGSAFYLARRMRFQELGDPLVLEAGPPIRTGFQLASLGAIPLVNLGWEWMSPLEAAVRLKRKGRFLAEEVSAQRRCRVTEIEREFVVRDVFGLCSIRWRMTQARPVAIFPNVGRMRNMPVVQSMAGGEGIPHPSGAAEGDRMDIRRYVPGDSVRNILWKTFARTRELSVRIPERSLSRARKTVAYLQTGPGDEPAAAAARVALEGGALGADWLFGADGTVEPIDQLNRALLAIAQSGSLQFESEGLAGPGLVEFLDQVSSSGSVHCIVFAPARQGPWLSTAIRAASRYSGQVSFVLATDGVVRSTPPPAWRRFLFRIEPARGTHADEMSGVLRSLAGAGCPTLVVDRPSGRTYGHAHQQALGVFG